MSDESVKIQGTVSAIVFQNEDNGYTVLRLSPDDGDELTAVGTIPGVTVGDRVELEGVWVEHWSYGEQLKLTGFTHLMPKSVKEIYSYLASGGIKGVGRATAKNIVNTFGADTFDILENHPHRLAEIKGITPKRAEEIGKSFRAKNGMRSLTEFLNKFDLSPRCAVRLYRIYGDDALAAVKDDPYILIDPNIGGDFSKTDLLAKSLGMSDTAPQRVRGAILQSLRLYAERGSVCAPRDGLVTYLKQKYAIPKDSAEENLSFLGECGDIVSGEVGDRKTVYLRDYYDAERYIIERIGQMISRPPEEGEGLDRLIASVERHRGITYAGQQRKAVALAGSVELMAITGGPGTGKTTAIRGIVDLFAMMGLKTVLTAPTGRAAKRMSEVTGEEASTVHRLLEAGYSEDDEESVFKKNEEDPLECDAVILDESSMVDIMLMKALLAAMPHGCRLVMVGDADQLPSVGPGTVFSDIISSGAVAVVRLTEIFRQADGSSIVSNAHMINRGERPRLDNSGSDFFFIGRADPDNAAKTIVELCTGRLEKMGMKPDQIQVLTPTKKGRCGTFELNRRLQEALNPPSEDKQEKKVGKFIFREGDKVMQIRNNYDIMWQSGSKAGFGVFNGDVGRILEIEPKSQTVTVDFEDRIAVYEFGQLVELEPAYAMTVHKSQGSEYRAVVFAATDSPPLLMTRSVLYTAITRARELLVMVGSREIVYTMVMNQRQEIRYSGLKSGLSELAQ